MPLASPNNLIAINPSCFKIISYLLNYFELGLFYVKFVIASSCASFSFKGNFLKKDIGTLCRIQTLSQVQYGWICVTKHQLKYL